MQRCFQKSGFKDQLNYIPPEPNNGPSKRKNNQKAICFNPPYSRNVKNNIGKMFLGILSKHFSPNHNMDDIFNTNAVKMIYR